MVQGMVGARSLSGRFNRYRRFRCSIRIGGRQLEGHRINDDDIVIGTIGQSFNLGSRPHSIGNNVTRDKSMIRIREGMCHQIQSNRRIKRVGAHRAVYPNVSGGRGWVIHRHAEGRVSTQPAEYPRHVIIPGQAKVRSNDNAVPIVQGTERIGF